MLQVQQYCEQNYSHALNLQIIARRFYMNPAYLGRLFKAETGCSFSDYLNRLQLLLPNGSLQPEPAESLS